MEENILNNNFVSESLTSSDIEPFAYDYDYRSYCQTMINNQSKIIDNQDLIFNMINQFNTFMVFFLAIIFVYQLFRNFIKR